MTEASSLALSSSNPDDRLQLFDLTVTEIHDRVIRAGLAAAGDVSPLAPRGTQGRHMNDACVAALRSVLLSKSDWQIEQTDGVSRTVHRVRHLAVVPASGNEHTGLEYGKKDVTTAWPKGPAACSRADFAGPAGFEAIDSVESNWKTPVENSAGEWTLWYLLYFRCDSEVRIELSAPRYFDKSGFPRGWDERIIIPSCLLNDLPVDDESDEDDDSDIVDVPVLPK